MTEQLEKFLEKYPNIKEDIIKYSNNGVMTPLLRRYTNDCRKLSREVFLPGIYGVMGEELGKAWIDEYLKQDGEREKRQEEKLKREILFRFRALGPNIENPLKIFWEIEQEEQQKREEYYNKIEEKFKQKYIN